MAEAESGSAEPVSLTEQSDIDDTVLHEPVNDDLDVDNSGVSKTSEQDYARMSSTTAVVKNRKHRERSEKSKQNRVNELTTKICRLVNRKLGLYEQSLCDNDMNDIDVLEAHLDTFEADGNEMLVMYNELNELSENEVDEQIKIMYTDFKQELDSNVQLFELRLDELYRVEDEAQAEAKRELERQMEELQVRKRRQMEARSLFEQREIIPPHQPTATSTVAVDERQSTGTGTAAVSERQSAPTSAAAVNDRRSAPTSAAAVNDRRLAGTSAAAVSDRQSVSKDNAAPKLSPPPQDLYQSNREQEAGMVAQLANSITASIRETKRSVIEPSIFSGDVLAFADWEIDFDDFLDAEGVTGIRKLRLLKKYLDGEAKKCVSGFLMSQSIDGYDDARSYLKQRYGKKINLSRQFKKKLSEWPNIRAKDSQGLRDFADFLAHCKSAMKTVPQLRSLDDADQNMMLMEKLPDWLQIKWKYKISEYEDTDDEFPDFHTFATFVAKEAKAANVLHGQRQIEKQTTEKKNFQGTKPKSVRSLKTNSHPEKTKKTACLYCGLENHQTAHCNDLVKMSYNNSLEWIKSKRLCYSCVLEGHRTSDCKNKASCKKCKKPHPTILHKTKEDWDATKQETKQKETQSSNTEKPSTIKNAVREDKPNSKGEATQVDVKNTKSKARTLSMVMPVFVSAENSQEETLTYALLDSQSDTCFISQEVASKVKPSFHTDKVSVSTMIGSKDKVLRHYQGIRIRNYYSQDGTTISAYEQDNIPCERYQIPTRDNTSHLTYLEKIRKELPPPLDIPVGLLLGTNCAEALAPIDHINGAKGEPFAIKTILGWTVCGGTNSQSNLHSLVTRTKKDQEIIQLIERDFKDCEEERMSQEDLKFLATLQKGTFQNKNGNYVLPLPFKKEEIELPLNRPQAERRLAQLLKRLKTDKNYQQEYNKFMNKLLASGHAEEVPANDCSKPGTVWYIPHFGVMHPKKKKIRVVFDASTKYEGISLNDVLLQGPDLMNSLVGILLRFRKEKVAICCDIESMFYNFYVPEPQRDYLRFLWLDPDSRQVRQYRMTVHLFGATSSPAVATFALRRLAADNKKLSEKAAEFLCEDFYVDDGITSVSTAEGAIQLLKDTAEMCSRGNVRLHKFISNDRDVMSSIHPSERSESTQKIDLSCDELPNERTLGIQWNVETDSFQFKLNIDSKPATKRGILSTVAQVYDPLGFVGPFILTGKHIQQKVTAAELDWDAPIPTEEKLEWERWLEDLKKIDKISIERCMKKAGMDVQTTQIHVFSDASLKGYGACCYLRQVGKDGTVHTTLLFGKSRVAPLKPVTIPRLELQAAVIAVRISKLVSRELKLSFDEMYFWCDSQIVLGYIANESKRFHMYVANRIHEIHQNSSPSQWHYVKSKDNPADMASRGASVDELINSSWFSGPDFLKEHDVKAYMEANYVIRKVEEHDPEVKPVKVLKTSASAPNIAHKFLKYSTFNGLVKSLAILRKAARKKTWKYVSATAEDMQEAEVLAIKRTQEMSFQEEIQTLKENKSVRKDSTIAKLNPYLDKQSILRVGGRLHRADITTDEKCPIIVPKYSHLAKLLVRHHHHRIHHLGRRSTLAATREAGYWIISGASTVKSTISDCIACSKLRKPPQEQLMGDLPAERVQRTPPFSHVGMDVFGPYHVRERRSTLKRYGLIFTCLYSRAVHIEMLDDLSTDSFINALRCLTAIRGHVTTLYSDNATNFVGAKNLFDKELEGVSDPKMQKYLLDHRIIFKNNTPEASHQGGAWERLIRSAKAVLNGMAINYKERIDSQTLRTAFYEVASILNHKPLTATNIGNPDEEIITPNRLLTMKRGQTSAPPPGEFTDSEVYGKARWKKAQQIADEFFKAWKSEYLSQITQRTKWHTEKQNIAVGDVVVLKDNNMPRNAWELAIIQDVHKGDDDKVRNVTLRMANRHLDSKGKPLAPPSILKRPIQKIVLLLKG